MLGYQSASVNGQLVNVAPGPAFDPIIFGQAYTGPAFWPRQGVYNVPPIMPAGGIQGSMAPASYGASGTGYQVPTATGGGSMGFFHHTKSPLWMALAFLIVGILMLQHIHYK